jgi:hypothetical protein
MAYTPPTIADFQARFPEFEDAEEELIQLALNDAARAVGTNWIEADYATGILLLAAHAMQVGGGAYDSGGLRSFSIGAISVTYADFDKVAKLDTTSYGQQFISLRNRNARGVVVI